MLEDDWCRGCWKGLAKPGVGGVGGGGGRGIVWLNKAGVDDSPESTIWTLRSSDETHLTNTMTCLELKEGDKGECRR
jgi:hypothetical protein